MRNKRRTVLLVEDHAESRTSLAYVLEKQGYAVVQAANGRAALAASRAPPLHAAIIDLKLPDMDGIAVLDGILEANPGLPSVVVTGFATIELAVEAMRRGASDFVTKPLQVDRLLSMLDRAIAQARVLGTVPRVAEETSQEMERLGMIGYSRAMRDLFETIKRIARFQSTVLVLGESGTGKELIARALTRSETTRLASS